MKNPIIMHINYCEQGQTLPEVFEVASRIGYDGIEFRRSGDNYHLPLESYLETIAALREQYHMPYILFGGPALDAMTSQRDTLQKNTEEYLHFLEVADHLGLLSTVNFMCGSIANPKVPMDLYHCESHGFAVHEPWQWHILAPIPWRQHGAAVHHGRILRQLPLACAKVFCRRQQEDILHCKRHHHLGSGHWPAHLDGHHAPNVRQKATWAVAKRCDVRIHDSPQYVQPRRLGRHSHHHTAVHAVASLRKRKARGRSRTNQR